MSKYKMVYTIVLAIGTTPALAIECSKVTVKSGDDFRHLKATLKQKNKKPYKVFSTKIDSDIKTNCSYSWSNPLDNWLYSDDDFLWKNNPGKYGKKEMLRVAGNRTQTKSIHYQCKGDDEDEDDIIGYYAYSTPSPTTMKLEFLCTLQNFQGQGYGLAMMNQAATNGNEKFAERAFTMDLIAHPKAKSFYNGLLMDCSADTEDNVTQHTYHTEFKSGSSFAPLGRKVRCLTEEAAGANYRIDYSQACLSSGDYQEFLEYNEKGRNFDNGIDTDALVAKCDSYSYGEEPMPYSDVVELLDDLIKEED